MKNKFTIIVSFLITIFLILFIFIVLKIHIVVRDYEEIIYGGIKINEVDVSFLSREEAIEKVRKNEILLNENRKIIINADNDVYEVTFKELDIQENIEEIVDVALNYGKSDRVIDKYMHIRKGLERSFKTSITLDEEAYDKVLKKIKKENNMAPINAVLEHNWNGFKITPHELGRSVDESDLKYSIKKAIEDNISGEDVIVNVNFKVEEPKIYEEDLKKVDSLIASYSTSFTNSGSGRSRNIEIAANYINGKVLMPMEEFSFNKIVGAATSGKGYSYAKVIKNGAYVDEVGGGICQVSSTLYNAILKTSLSIIERRNHSKVVNYVPKGQDAMIAYGVSDFKFINNFKYPVYIEALVNNKTITFNIYSNKETADHVYQIKNEVVKEIKPKKEIIYDYSLSNGSAIIQQEGKNGYVINTYRVRYEDGKMVEKNFVTESIYRGKNTIVRIGKR